jgi:hypothetical protein
MALAALLAAPGAVRAGGPLVVDADGRAVAWHTAGPVPFATDRGPLGVLSNAQAVALVEQLMGVWGEVPTSTLRFARAGELPVDVDATNFGPFLGPYGGATAPIGANAVVFDADGAIFDQLFGTGTRVAGFAGPTFMGNGSQTVPIGEVPPPGSRIVEALVFLNGRFLDGVDDGGDNPEMGEGDLEALVVHELGHFAGLGHTQIHGLPAETLAALGGPSAPGGKIETMFPFLRDSGQADLERDDRVSLSQLYPVPGYSASTGCATGRVLTPDRTGVSGVDVLAESLADGADALSTVTDADGRYALCGLEPGTAYRVRVQEIDAFHTMGRRVGPYSPPLPLPGPAELYSGSRESADPALDSPNDFEPVSAGAGQTVEGIDLVLNRQRFRVHTVTLADDRSPQDFAPGDFDGDGRLDFVAVQEGTSPGNSVTFHRGRGDGSFEPARIIGSFTGVARAVAGQFNSGADSDLDVAVASTFSNEVRLYLGNGHGGFAPPVPLAQIAGGRRGTAQLLAADLDGDAFTDLVFAVEEEAGGLTVQGLLGSGSGNFTPVTTRVPATTGLRLASGAQAVAGPLAAGGPDSVVVSMPPPGAPRLGLLTGDGHGGFTGRRRALASVGAGLGGGDLDGDGDLDLAVADAVPPGAAAPSGPTVALLRGDGAGGFALTARFPTSEAPAEAIAVADFDRDGVLDAAVTGAVLTPGSPGAAVDVAFGDGAGGVRTVAPVWGVAEFPRVLGSGDFDGDGAADLITSGKHHGLLGLEFPARWSVLLNLNTPPEPCRQSDTALCLKGDRFRVEMQWENFQGGHGVGHPQRLTSDTGYFWFFNRDNLELVVKVLDGGPVNGRYWVFSGALSNVRYTLTVTDTATGASKIYRNEPGHFGSFGDTGAFPAPPAGQARPAGTTGDSQPVAAPSNGGACGGDPERALCLNRDRFRIGVTWRDFQGNSGAGTAVPLTPDSGYFWFFNPANVELAIKVLDGRPVNGHFWVFYGALSNVEYTITVTDTQTGAVRTYRNPAHQFASRGDTAAF